MVTKTNSPNRYSGIIYFVDELELTAKTYLPKELLRAKAENGVSWKIKDGRTVVPLSFDSWKAYFVVFSELLG